MIISKNTAIRSRGLRKKVVHHWGLVAVGLLLAGGALATPDERRTELIKAAQDFLDNHLISYTYGGNQMGAEEDCQHCLACATRIQPHGKIDLKACPVCRHCSLDCSHFTQLVYSRVGLAMPYLSSQLMTDLGADRLAKLYKLVDLGTDVSRILPGDLLVYRGHVVLVERVHSRDRGDVIHSTAGREIRAPGQAIQRMRRTQFSYFRSPLRRILRHKGLMDVQGSALRPVVGRRR